MVSTFIKPWREDRVLSMIGSFRRWEGGDGRGGAVSVDRVAGEIELLGDEDHKNPR